MGSCVSNTAPKLARIILGRKSNRDAELYINKMLAQPLVYQLRTIVTIAVEMTICAANSTLAGDPQCAF
jgi:hypothetical protein